MPAGGATVLIVEPNMEGHRFNYVRILVDECRRHGIFPVVLTTPSGKEDYLRKADGHYQPGWQTLPGGRRPRLPDLEMVSRQLSAAKVVIPDGDRTALALARRAWWRGSGELRVLIMRATAQSSNPQLARLKGLARKLAFTVAARISGVTLLTLTSALAVQEHQALRVADPIEFAPTDEARRVIADTVGMPDGRFWFGIAGWLDARKNVPLVLEALMVAADRTERPLGLLLAGQQEATLKRYLETTSLGEVRVAHVNRHLTAAELDAAIALSDCMVMAHSNDGPSGILGKAAAAGTQIIAAGSAVLAEDCMRLGPSAQWVRLDCPSLVEAVVTAVSRPKVEPFAVATPTSFATSLLGL